MTTQRRSPHACLLLCVGVAMAQDKAKQDKSEEAGRRSQGGLGHVDRRQQRNAQVAHHHPWKSSEIGRDTDFKSTLLSQEITPIDKPSFLRELDFYKLSNRN